MKYMFALVFIIVSFFSQADEFCSNIASKADAERTIISSDESGYRVSGKGRLYFYTAPNERCKNSDVFIVSGDLVNASADYEGYTYIMYFTKEGKEFDGWVKSNRLIPTGTGIGPSDNTRNDE